jgi:hypothetical protein
VNAVITAFKRTGDLSGCTLYTTLSPCDDCSLTVARAGIRNLVFAKYYRNGCHMYDILGRIPDMDIRFYKDITGESKKSYIITINLSRLIVKIDTSEDTQVHNGDKTTSVENEIDLYQWTITSWLWRY